MVALSPTIRIDNEVYAWLKERAEPFVDTPNTVLRRVAGLDQELEAEDAEDAGEDSVPRTARPTERPAPGRKAAQRRSPRKQSRGPTSQRRKRTRVASELLLPEDEYVEPILRALEQRDGEAPARAVIEAVGEVLTGRLTETDLQTLDSGTVRWVARTQFVRLRLVKEGLLSEKTPRGVWAISDKGHAWLARHGTDHPRSA